jgi:hypothetical protein
LYSWNTFLILHDNSSKLSGIVVVIFSLLKSKFMITATIVVSLLFVAFFTASVILVKMEAEKSS